jgi:deoxyadenosine/deoxycytidine kinase
MLFDQGHIEDVNYQIYLRWFDNFLEESNLSRVVYVKTDPALCHQRIAKRARVGESIIPLAYLEDCHNYHESMLEYLSKSETLNCSEQLVIDGNVDIFEQKDALSQMLELVQSFVL